MDNLLVLLCLVLNHVTGCESV